jgi:hypothetical protein
MRVYFTFLLMLWAYCACAQDPGMQAAQMAAQQAQMATQMATQAAQQANDQMMQAAQQANQQAMQNAQQAAQNTWPCYRCFAAKPTFSVEPGAYSSAVTVKMKDSTRGAVIYYTTDGWTPTDASTRYTGPITIDSTTTLQAIAISPHGGRSRIAKAVYTLSGVAPAPPVQQSPPATSDAAVTPAASANLLLARGTLVPLVFASDVSSEKAEVGDKISVTLADDVKVGDVVVVRKGTPAVATVTEVDGNGVMGVPGEIFFQADSILADGAVIKLRGSAAKEGRDHEGKAFGLMFVPVVPVGLFVRGNDAEIKQGSLFTAFVDADVLLPPAK